MMDLVGNWLTGVTAAAILCALANSLMPDGPVRRVGRLACGLAVLAAVLGPVLRLEPMEPEAWLEEYGQVMAVQRQELEQTRAETARVTCAGEGGENWLPDRVTVRGTLTPSQREALSREIRTGLGIPETHQSFETEEESP